jgi:hypothetical protein
MVAPESEPSNMRAPEELSPPLILRAEPEIVPRTARDPVMVSPATFTYLLSNPDWNAERSAPVLVARNPPAHLREPLLELCRTWQEGMPETVRVEPEIIPGTLRVSLEVPRRI